tara:strand:+ start:34 stop:543 length:510 start_codon:yes stop_codon:yes gene_type:complete
MKESIEHKILRYLKDNDNGDFINVTNLIDNRKLLESKLQSLSEEPEKYISFRLPVFFFGIGLPNKENNELKAKIEINGIVLLDKIENGNKTINNSGIYIDAKNNKGIQSFEKIELKKNNTKHKTYPNKNPSIWEMTKSFVVKFWWKILIPLLIGIFLILIKRGDIDIGI